MWDSGTAEPLGITLTGRDGCAQRLVGWVFRTAGAVAMVTRQDQAVAGSAVLLDAAAAEVVRADAEDAAAVGSWEWDPATELIEVSPSTARLLRLEVTGALRGLGDLLARVGEDERVRVGAVVNAALDTEAPFTTRFTIGVGARRTIRATGRPVLVRGTRRVAGIVEDITETDHAEKTVQRSQRLASLGMLAAGIAHDVNNVLTVVTMRADMIREDAQAGAGGAAAAAFAADATAILDAARRATDLTRQLMLFAGRQEGETRAVDLAELTGRLRPLLESLRGSRIRSEYAVAPVPPVHADPSQLEQVLLNLAINARDALTGAGAAVTPDRSGGLPTVTVRVLPERATASVVLEVEDNGPGMDAETLANACEPFFTTKTAGRGTGLGLAVVSGIVDRLGGRLEFASEVGVGTTARVVLPASPAAGAPGANPAAAVADRVLVVDDDPEVLAAHARILDRAGFAVTTASDGGRALAALAAHPETVAVVSDVDMPGMDGAELTGRVLRDRPTVRLLLVTGLDAPADVVVHPRVGVVAKPVTGSLLLASLRSLLAG